MSNTFFYFNKEAVQSLFQINNNPRLQWMMGLKHFEGDPSELQNALEPIRNEFINSWLSNTAI